MKPIKRKTFFYNLLLLLVGLYALIKFPFKILFGNKSSDVFNNVNNNIFSTNKNAVKRNSNI
jgi:hypothetical protein